MKVKIERKPDVFSPVDLTLTIENKEEAVTLLALFDQSNLEINRLHNEYSNAEFDGAYNTDESGSDKTEGVWREISKLHHML